MYNDSDSTDGSNMSDNSSDTSVGSSPYESDEEEMTYFTVGKPKDTDDVAYPTNKPQAGNDSEQQTSGATHEVTEPEHVAKNRPQEEADIHAAYKESDLSLHRRVNSRGKDRLTLEMTCTSKYMMIPYGHGKNIDIFSSKSATYNIADHKNNLLHAGYIGKDVAILKYDLLKNDFSQILKNNVSYILLKNDFSQILPDVLSETLKDDLSQITTDVLSQIPTDVLLHILKDVLLQIPTDAFLEILKDVISQIPKDVLSQIPADVVLQILKYVLLQIMKATLSQIEKANLSQIPNVNLSQKSADINRLYWTPVPLAAEKDLEKCWKYILTWRSVSSHRYRRMYYHTYRRMSSYRY